MTIRSRVAGCLIALVTALGLAVGIAPAAQAETNVPNFFKQSYWWNTPNPSAVDDYYDLTVLYGSSDKWLYPNFPIACNPTPGDTNHYSVIWAYPSDTALNYNQPFVRDVLAAATSVFPASAREVINSKSYLKSRHSPRWKTTTPNANGNCHPDVQHVAVPPSTLTVGTGSGYWHPYRANQLDDWLEDNGYIGDPDEKVVVLVQQWGTPGGHKGITTSSSDSRPGRENYNNDGGDSIYVNMEGYGWGPGDVNEWADPAHSLAHEITHNLGAFVDGSTHEVDGNHASDCADILCERTDPPYYAAPGCGLVGTGLTLPALKQAKGYNRLDCGDDDYWDPGLLGLAGMWNTFNNSFLWANSSFEQ